MGEWCAIVAGPSVTAYSTVEGAQISPALRVEGLRKAYAGRAVVDDLSFSVATGEVFALLGPNGAGKTTTIEILEGYRTADGGVAEVLGQNPQTSLGLKQQIGIMPQQLALYPHITVREALQLFTAYYCRPAGAEALLSLVGLTEQAGTRFRVLSGGEKQRLSLALALAGTPSLVFLDEPTASMDPQARLITWDLIASLRAQGITVLLTTHYLEEAHRLADRVAIVNAGRLVALDTPDRLTGRSGGAVRFVAAPGIDLALLARLPGCASAVEERPGGYALRGPDPDELLIDLALWSRSAGIRVRDLRVERATLEEVFLRLTGEEPSA
jgi:ABC-2 type transport system ATP-binding protein